MRTIAIIQARMGSTRLPGKVLKDICGDTMLSRVVRRTQRATLLDNIVIATTEKADDQEIASECDKHGIQVFRGNEEDVLDRYLKAAKEYKAEAVVRITSDCPLIDPEVIDQVIRAFLGKKPDYASNFLERTYPQGLETEIMTFNALNLAWHEGKLPYQRIHVTPYIFENPTLFNLLSVKADGEFCNTRWTVDTPEDLEFVRAVYGHFGENDTFT